MKNIKIIIGANYGDEGKGLVTRHFVKTAKFNNENPIVIFHNGTAQRGHTVDYNPKYHHVFHHFGCGTGDGAPTFFARTFWVHPMEFAREYVELARDGIYPQTFCDPEALIITPFDMLIDHATEAWIGLQRGEREHGSCGYGTWCATDRYPDAIFTVKDFANEEAVPFLLEEAWKSCLAQLVARGVDVEQLQEYKDYFIPNSQKKINLIQHFKQDLHFFYTHTSLVSFDWIYSHYNTMIFENGQGLGLDQNVDSDWHTTSNTGLTNPYQMLKNMAGFNAEVCYVSRSYLTRHGIGPLEEAVRKSEINADMIDLTNVHNEFQGGLRYGYLADKDQKKRIVTDWNIVSTDKRFIKTMALTHCNEFEDIYKQSDYVSYNPFSVLRR